MNDNFYLVQLAGAIGTFAMPVVAILIVFLFGYLKKKRQYHLAEVMVEKGQQLPESFFEKKDSIDSSVKLLKYGLIFLAVGIGAAIFGLVKDNISVLALSSVPALVGVAYLIVSFVVRKKEKAEAQKIEAPEN